MPSGNDDYDFLWVKKSIAYFLLTSIILITLLSWGSSWYGWHFFLELLSHFKVQYLLLSLFCFFLLVLLRQKRLVLIALFLIIIQLTEIAPWYLSFNGLARPSTEALHIFSSNINVKNKNYAQVIALVTKESPDIAIFMEVDDIWIDRFKALSDVLPYAYTKPNPYNLGIAVYSKQPFNNVSFDLFGTPNNPSLIGDLTVNEQEVTLIATHPLPPARQDYFHLRNKQLDEIRKYVNSLTNSVIVVGDLNITMWSPYYKRFEQKTKLVNARKGFGILPTWPTQLTFAKIPRFFSPLLWIPLDHCLISPDIKVANFKTHENIGSDHLPLDVELRIPKVESKT